MNGYTAIALTKLDILDKENIQFYNKSETEFNEFEPRIKSSKSQFQLSAGLNRKTLNTILSVTYHINLSRGSNSLNSALGNKTNLGETNFKSFDKFMKIHFWRDKFWSEIVVYL